MDGWMDQMGDELNAGDMNYSSALIWEQFRFCRWTEQHVNFAQVH